MSVKYSIQTHGDVLSDTSRKYSPPSLDAALSTAEKFFVAAKTTNVSGSGSLSLTVTFELSNDGYNWQARGATPVINGGTVVAGAATILTGYDDGISNACVGGRFMRVVAQLGGTTPGAYVEIWVCGRSLY